MKIFDAEREAGLEQAIANNRSLAFTSRLEAADKSVTIAPEVWNAVAIHFGQRPPQDTFDLYPVNTILVTVGWNKNDDIFMGYEVWAARHSPEDKPFNLGHEPRIIIGHITGNVGVDDDLQVIPDNINPDDLPAKFHLLTSAVIYRHLGKRDPELTEEAAALIADIEAGNKFVSMECLFDGFDYGFRSMETGKLEHVVARQADTAFLTKHLRAYKGRGEYNGYSVGRVLRGITFSGKGLVDNPANPESEFIFNDIQAFAGQLADSKTTQFLIKQFTQSEDDSMSIENDLRDRVKDLEASLAEKDRKLAELDAAAVQSKLDAKDGVIAEQDKTINGLKSQVEELTAKITVSDEAKAKAEEALAQKTEECEAATKKLGDIEAEAARVTRISTLVDKGVEKARAEEIVEKFGDLNDEKFEAVVAMQAELVQAKKPEETKAEEEQSDEAGASEGESEEAGETEESVAADEDALSAAEEETEPDMAAASETVEEEKDEATAQLSFYLGSVLKRGRKRS